MTLALPSDDCYSWRLIVLRQMDAAAHDNQMTRRLQSVRERMSAAAMRAGLNTAEVKLVAVSKTYPSETVLEGIAAGVADVGALST